jgi:uncharacterized protein
MPRLEAGASRIEGRTAEGWIVAGRLYAPALLVTPARAGTLRGVTFETLDADAMPELPGAELLLLGTGVTLRRPPPAFLEGARARGWRVEPMDSPAAARTFNVLAAEDRPVAALIL